MTRVTRLALTLACLGATTATGACGGARVSDPHAAAARFAEAAARGDADAIYGMLTPAAARALTREDVRRLVKDEAGELADEAQALTHAEARTSARARLRFADGEHVSLDLSEERFGVTTAGGLPGGAASPEAALDELRRAVARRSYPALLRLLSPTTRAAVEQDLRTLVGGLEHPETLSIHTNGDAAHAVVPGGHHVTLRRDGGVWHVEDFD